MEDIDSNAVEMTTPKHELATFSSLELQVFSFLKVFEA